ncbi:flagellar biosynthesis anti-sigma factor FlgM [Desulfovibrio sp. ZJ200]|uniref:flagellar biosynthesis anti-sigma factor FlgM n=1 Tax=Desulfovibrio sp. ZJ200 TaxID=2709792 RepID=UPI0013EC8C87|nr:flagellar biosynthesis anti-sigma factor FlgM [Desulfovibrio sp. ZJ200]
MEIKCNSSPLLDPYAAGTEKTGQARSRPATENAADAARGDTVSVSQDALLLTEARRAAQNAPDVRADKVEALRIQVADGTYKPDSRLIASGLIREEPGLFRL